MDRFEGCTAISCSRLTAEPRTHISYRIKETCRYFLNSTCTYKDPVRVERKDNGREAYRSKAV